MGAYSPCCLTVMVTDLPTTVKYRTAIFLPLLTGEAPVEFWGQPGLVPSRDPGPILARIPVFFTILVPPPAAENQEIGRELSPRFCNLHREQKLPETSYFL